MWLENGDIYWMYVEDDAIRKYVNEALGGGKVLEINNHQAQLINLSAEDEILVIRHYYDESFSTPRVEGKVGSGSHPPYTYDLLQIRSTGRF
jgi:hypothetical protein